jgi:hypothetical protein
MARNLSNALDAATGPNAQDRRPAWRVDIYDVRSTSEEITPTRINDVVILHAQGFPVLPTIVGPRDFTADIQEVLLTEVAGDYASNGVAATTVEMTILDPTGTLDPLSNPAPSDGRWLRQRNVVVIREGDARLDESEWFITFTGELVGQPGQDRNRTTGNSTLRVRALSREAAFINRLNTSRDFAQGSSYQDIAQAIAEEDMGLDIVELNLPTFSVRNTSFLSTQFVEENPLISIAKLMFVDGFMPRFEGDGRLGAINGRVTKAPARVYTRSELPISIIRPITEANGPNEVELVGLDPDLSKVVQHRQELKAVDVTSGFFTGDFEVNLRWSDDGTQQAQGVRMEVLNSIGDGIFSFGDEEFTAFIQADGGSVNGRIDVDGALAESIALAGLVAGAWIGLSFVPDAVIEAVITQPIGRVVHAVVGQLLFTILGNVGRGDYLITGEPYEYVFQEIRCIARVSTVRPEERHTLEIENHLINDPTDCTFVAERVLERERKKQNTRNVEIIHDLRLEPDDIFQVGVGTSARRYMISQIRRQLSRNELGTIATMDCFETTSGVFP